MIMTHESHKILVSYFAYILEHMRKKIRDFHWNITAINVI